MPITVRGTGHDEAESRRLGPTGAGSVLLDIGGDRGALVVRTEAAVVGREVEIRRVGEPWAGRHVAVRRRVVAGATFAAALFGPLPGAPYQVRWRDRQSAPGPVVSVRPGSVSEVALASPADAGIGSGAGA